MHKKRTFTIWIVIGVLAIAGIVYAIAKPSKEYDSFAQCLADKDAKFYGAWWCTHCNAQKQAFGTSKGYLPYVECSTPDGDAQLDVCKQENITGYPTWVFADGSRLSGSQTFEKLAQKTGCALP